MTYYEENHEYDDQLRALKSELKNQEKQILDLTKKAKAHTDLKSREIYVRRQEQSITNRIIAAEHAEFYDNLRNMIKKHDIIKAEWERLIMCMKLLSDAEDATTVMLLVKLIEDEKYR